MRKFFTIASLFALALSACTKEAAKGDEKGEGQVSISCVTVTEVDDTRANVSCTTPQRKCASDPDRRRHPYGQ